MARTLTITVEVDDSVDLAQLERTVEHYNEGACDDVVVMGFGGQIFRFEEVTRFEYAKGPGDEEEEDTEDERAETDVSASLVSATL